MGNKMRSSGIESIANVPWGTHICQFYHTKQDLIDILVPYFKAGLENNEYCVWVCWEPLNAQEARVAAEIPVRKVRRFIESASFLL